MNEHPGTRWLLRNSTELASLGNKWVALTGDGPLRDEDGQWLARVELSELLDEMHRRDLPTSEFAFHLVDHPTWG